MTEAAPTPPHPPCQVVTLGVVDYQQAWDLQLELVQAVHNGDHPNTLLLLEHPHVYTKGRLSKPEQVLASPDWLEAQGIPVVETDRGGLVTYHGPGQLVGYPVVNLRGWGGPLQYVRALEQVIIRALADFGVAAGLIEGLTGVWVNGAKIEAKIAAIGVKISRGVAHHGFAINVNTDLSYFGQIIPCGMADREVTSLAQVLGQPVDLAKVKERVGQHFCQVMGFEMVAARDHADFAAKRWVSSD